MTIGTGYFFPQGQFSVQRSYVTAVAFDQDLTLASHSGTTYKFNWMGITSVIFTWTFLPEFFPWSSNSYTLDHLIIESYIQEAPGFAIVPYDFRLWYWPGTPTTPPGVKISPTVTDNTPTFYNLPPRDQPYWLPDL